MFNYTIDEKEKSSTKFINDKNEKNNEILIYFSKVLKKI